MSEAPEQRVASAKNNMRAYGSYTLRFYLYLFLALLLSLVAASLDQRWLIPIILAGAVYFIARGWKRARAKMRKV